MEDIQKLLIEFFVVAEDASRKYSPDGHVSYAYLSGIYRSIIPILLLSDNPIEALKNEIKYLKN